MTVTKCPTCGSHRIKKVRREVRGETGGRAYRAEAVVFYDCPDCGEKVYDREAMRQIEAARAKVQSKRQVIART